MAPRHSAQPIASGLAQGLADVLTVDYQPLGDTVARFDHHSMHLVLDRDSPAGDHCWAMLQVIHLLAFGDRVGTDARPCRHLRVLRD